MDDNKVSILLEDLQAQFRTFGEGLQLVNEKLDRHDEKMDRHYVEFLEFKEQNQQEHTLLKQMVQDISTEQVEIKKKVFELDREFEIELKRVK